ncbi:MAG: hypothetical protein GY719_02300 [bacterium]|nr:hypothetical protein [bacterium]
MSQRGTWRRCLIAWLLPAMAATAAAAQRAPRVLAADSALEGSRAVELRWPVAVAAASSLEIAVADAWGPRLVIFTTAAGSAQTRAVDLPASPLDVAFDGERYVVALRGRGALVTVEGPDFEPRSLGLPAGVVPGPLAAAPGGGLLLYDAAGGRVLTLDAAGAQRGETMVAGHLTALVAGAGGGFYAGFAGLAEIRRYGPDGSLLATWTVPGEGPLAAWPSGMVVEPGGDLLIADRHAGRIVVLDAAGRLVGVGSRRGWDAGQLLEPAGMTRLPDGRLAVADQGNGRLQIFRRLDGRPAP